MEVTHVADDRREQDAWPEELRAKYDGPPPIPLDVAEERARRELGVEATARYPDYVYQETRENSTTIVEFSNGTSLQFFPKRPPGGPYRQGRKIGRPA